MRDVLITLLGWAWGVGALLCLWFAVEVLRSRRQEQAMVAWLLLFALTPPLGALLYLGLGSRKLRRQAERKPRPAGRPAGPETPGGTAINDLDHLVQAHGLPAATESNRVAFRGTAATAYDAVLELIGRAEERLWVATYILGADDVAGEVLRRLAQRAAEGVQVRLLIDDVGSKHVRDDALAPLIAAGGRVARFMPISLIPRPRRYANLRNHRKIIVADRRIAWSGGMNLSEAYLGPTPAEFRFRDLSFVVEGPAAEIYAEVFAADWLFAAGEDLRAERWAAPPARAAGPGVVQVVPGGPEFPGDPLHDILLSAAYRAKRRLWIVSPYVVSDAASMKALVVAARRGVDVRLVTHRKSDTPVMDFANIPYLRVLAAAGGEALRLREGIMIHAKALVADDDLAIAGTANLDQRSLFLNFEVMALFHGAEEAQAIAGWIEEQFADCDNELPPFTPVRQVAEGFVRLFAPIL